MTCYKCLRDELHPWHDNGVLNVDADLTAWLLPVWRDGQWEAL